MSQIIIFDDLTAPVLSAPIDTTVDDANASLSVDTDKDNGTAYWVVTQAATQPSSAQIQAGQDHASSPADASGSSAVTVTGTQSFNAGGLTGSTSYWAHFVHVDVSTNESNVISGDGFTTDPGADVTPPNLTNPTDVFASATTATLTVDTDEGNGTLYYVVTTSSTAPSQAQVKLGQDHTGSAASASGNQVVASTGTKNFTATGLAHSTSYFSYFMHEDAATNQSTVSAADGFSTPTIPSDQTLTGDGTWNRPTNWEYFDLTVTVDGPGGGGGGGGGGANILQDGSNGSNGKAALAPATWGGMTANTGAGGGNGKGGENANDGGDDGNSGNNGSNGTATGGNQSNTTGGGRAGGLGGAGGEGVTGGGSGGDGGDGGSGGQAVSFYSAGSAPTGQAYTTPSGGSKGSGGNGKNNDGDDGNNGTASRILIAWSAP